MPGAKILYAGTLDPGGTARHRMEALRRLGHAVVPFNFSDYLRRLSRIANWTYHRTLSGPHIGRLNNALIAVAEKQRPNFILVDKGIFIAPKTIRYLSKSIGRTIQYNLDNPFGFMREPSWRRLVSAIPEYDIHFVPREINLADYRSAGAKRVIRVPLAYEPTVHYPPPLTWDERDRAIDVSFTGSPYDDRADFLTRLLTDYGISVDVRGNRWDEALAPDIARQILTGPALYDDDYRERFWKSRLCLSFVTHANRDQVAHKSFEIAASGGGVLLAEGTDEHRAMFAEGTEALFFDSLPQCAQLIRDYLPRAEERAAMARAAYRRSLASGYSNDARLGAAMETVRSLFSS